MRIAQPTPQHGHDDLPMNTEASQPKPRKSQSRGMCTMNKVAVKAAGCSRRSHGRDGGCVQKNASNKNQKVRAFKGDTQPQPRNHARGHLTMDARPSVLL